uniref:FHA domain-containing protein n=1 Tax=Branchiostoma floridae TaxID=7739 RepID=C3YFP6_BRAFL|eukprot:XP_002604999.1 hypothetical protein BRAFLDRAFT_129807 [Branchiostoma floridae]
MTRPQNSDGRPQFHLRRISHRTLNTAANNICSSAWPQRIFLSRRHCRLVRSAADDSHRLIDSSMTGVYVNDVKIAGSCVLEEGDVVTFGHPKGDTIKAGTRVRQPDSEHQFVGAAPTTPEMLGSFRVPKTVPKRKAQSPAVLSHGRPTQGGASSIGSSETTPPSSRRRPQTRSQGRHVTNPGSRSSTRPYTTQKDVGIQSGESSLESDTDTETGFLDETRKTMVKGKSSEKDVGNHSKTNHNGSLKLSAPVQSPARPTKSLGSKNPVKNDVDKLHKEVSGIDIAEEHVEDHPLDLTLKFDQTGFDNKVDLQEVNQNGHELGVQNPGGKLTSTDNTTNNSKAPKQPEEGAQEPSNEQVTVDKQREELQQTAQFDKEGNVEEEPSKQPYQEETDMDAFGQQGQKDAESAKVVDNDPMVGTKAVAMEDGCLPTPPAAPSKDAFENMSGHSVQSTEDKSVLSKETEEGTSDVHGLVEDTLSPKKIFEESPKPVEDSSGQSPDKVLVEDDPCGVEGTEIADVQTDEQEIKDTFADKLTDVDVATMSPKPVEDSMVQSQDNVTIKDDHCGLEKKEIADVLTDEQAFEDKLTDVDVAAMSPKPVEDSIARSPFEDHLSLEKKEIADVSTDEQEKRDAFADKLTDVDVATMSPKPVEDSMVQSQDNVSVEDQLSLEKKEIADVLTDEQEKKDPFEDKLTDVDVAAMSPKPVEDSIARSPFEDHLSLEKKEIADVSTDEQEKRDAFADKLTDVDVATMSPKPVEDSMVQSQDNVSVEDQLSLEKKEVADVLTDEQEKKDPFPDKLTDIHEDTPVKCPDPVENNFVQSHDNVSDESHHSAEKKKIALTDEQEMKGPIVERLTDEDGTAMSPKPVEDDSIQVIQDDSSIKTSEDEQDLSSTNPSNQTEEKDSSVKIDDLINDQYKNTTESQSEDKTMPTEGKVTDPTLTEPSVLELEDEVQMSELLQSPKKPEPPCNKSAIDDTTVLQVEEAAPLTDGMEKEENDLEETNVSQTSQRTSTPSAEEKENNQMKDSSDHFFQSEPASGDDDDPSISRPSPIIEQLHEKSTLNIAPNDSTAWVLKEFEDLEGTPEILAVSKTCNTKDASQDFSQRSCNVPSSENEREKETIPSSQGSNREFDSGESSDDHMGILRLSPSGRNGDNSSQSLSDAENEDVETPLSQKSTYSDFGLSGVVPFVASPTNSQEDSREALYSKVVAEIQANEENTAMPTPFGMQDQGSSKDNNGTTGFKKSVTWDITDSCLDTNDQENDDPSRDDLDDDFSDRDSRFIISDSIDYRAEDNNYPSESESSSSDEEKPSSAPIEGVGLGLHMSDSEGEAEERRHSSQSVSQHKEHSSHGHQVKHQNKDVSDPQEESYEEKEENELSEPTDNEDVPSGDFQEISTQLTKTEEEKKEVLPLEEISPGDARLSQGLQTQETGTGKLQNMKEAEVDVVTSTESDLRVVTSGISMVIKRSSSHEQQNQDRDNDSERDISNPHINQEEASNSSLEESGSKGQLNTESDQSANGKLLCADNVNTHNHVEEKNTAIDDQPCVVGTEVMSGSKRLHDESDTVLPHNKRVHLDAQLEEKDNTEVEGFVSMDVASEGCENVAEDLPFATEDRFDMQCDVTEDIDTAPLKQMSLPLILVKSRADCVRDVVLDFFSHRFFVNKISSKLDKIAEDARKQKVAEEVKKFFASDAWKEQPKTTPMEESVEPVSETASDSNSSAKKRDDFTHKESSSLEVDKRKVIEHAVYEFFRKKNFAGRKKEDLGTEDTVGSETGNKVQTMPKKRRNSEEQMLENAPEAKRQRLQEVSKELDVPISEDTPEVHAKTQEAPQQHDVCRESIGDKREEVNSSQTYISLSESQDCKTFADIQEDSKDYEVKANQYEQNQTLTQDQQDKNREEISCETSNTNDKDNKETETPEEMNVSVERDISDKDGHKLETSTKEMDIHVEPEQHNDKEITVDAKEVHMEICLSTGSDSKNLDNVEVDSEDKESNSLSLVSLSAKENVMPLEESIEESPAQASEEEVVATKNLPQENVLSDNTPLTTSPRRGQNTDPANNKDCDEIMLDTASSTHSPIEIEDVQSQDLAEVDSKDDTDLLQPNLPAIEEASLEKPSTSLPSDNGTCPPSQSKEPDQTSQEDVAPEVGNDIEVVQEDSGTDVNSDSSLPSPDGYSDSESDKDSDYSDNDRFLSSNSMEYGAEFDSDEDMDGSDEDGEDNDSSEDEEDDDDDDGDANSEDDDDDDEDGSSSTPKSPPPSSTAEKTNIASKGCPDTEKNVESSKTAMSGELDYANEVVIKETEMQRNEMALQGLSCDFDDDDEFSAPHINIDDIDFDDDNFDDDSNQSMETNSNLHSPVTSVGKDTPAQEKTSKAAVQVSEIEKSKKVTNVALTEENLGLGTSRESAGDPVTRPQAFKSRNLASGKDAGDTTPGVGKDKENYVTQMTEETPGVMPTSAGRTRRRLVDTPGKVTTDNAPRYMEQCQTILANLQGTLDREPSLKDISRVQAWKKEAAKLGDKMSLPETIIAVVGDTGAGKSSLMNALLDQSSVLPTSGMRACTAVVVEVSNNDRNKNYEADVEFLSRKEWDDELRLLLTDLIGEDGKAKRKPDPQSEAGIAWSKIKAVYGRVESYDVLSKLPHVRHLLGTTKHISKSRAREFRSEIDRYVDSMDAPPARGPGSRDRSGGQLWPIVKRVKVQIPNCEVCSSGAILVDLPGVRDSNAARDNIAKQYFKNCNAIWIVASIHRAVDDKTAKELLGEGFRRQLLMDGQYGSIAFICTKTDDLRCSEIIRALNLEDEVEQLENEINALEVEKMSLTEELESLREEEEVTDDELSGIQQEVNDLKEGVFELEQTVEPLGDEEVIVDDEDREQLNSLRSILEEKQNTEQETKTSLEDIRSQIADKEKEMAGVERQVSRKQKQMSVMCAKARNQYSQTQIKADFKAGIREMKRKAGMMGEDADSDDDDEEEAGDQEEEDIARGLRVFTVSSTEYLKLTNKLTRDGPAQVFSSVADTQIPALREFVHEMTNVRRQSGTEKLIRSLGSFVSDIASYLLDEGTKNHGTRMSAKSIFEHHLGKLKTSLQPVLGTLQTDVDRSISICIHPKLKEGVAAAASMCQAVAKKWGAPTCKENRQAGGLHYSTYKATVRRSGVYKSPTYGPIDMNEDLSSPLYNTITISWQKVFDNGTLFFSLDNCKHSVLSTLKEFLLKLRTELQALGMDADRVNRVGQQQLNSTKMRLDNAVAELKEFITGQQREISRVMTPAVQTRMEPAYETCTNERGPGSFNRMRNHMDVHVAYEKDVMFDQASQFLLKQLADLEVDIVARMQVLCDQLCDDLAVLYEPFWEAPVHCTILKKHLMDDMLAIHGKVKALFEEAELKDLPPLPEPAPQSAVSQSGPDVNFSLMNTPGSSNMATGARPAGSNPVTMVTPNQPFTLQMKQELVDNYSYGTPTQSTSQYGVRPLPPGAMSMTANAVTSRGLEPSFSNVGTHMTASMQLFQASTSTYTSLPHIKREANPQIDSAGASTPLLNPTAVNQFRKRTLQGMTGPDHDTGATKQLHPANRCSHQSVPAHLQNSSNTCACFQSKLSATTTGSYGSKTGKQPSANVATKNVPSAKFGMASTSTYSDSKSVASQGSSSAKGKAASSKSLFRSPSNGQTGLIGKSTTKKGGKGKGARGTPTTVPVARQQALRVKQEPRSPLRENQSRKKRKFPPDEIIDLTLDD